MKYKILKYFISIREKWSPAAIREIKILEMENEGPFVKYTTLENNHLYGSLDCSLVSCESVEMFTFLLPIDVAERVWAV